MVRIYGVPVCEETRKLALDELTEDEKIALVNKYCDDEMYTLGGFFNYLNNDGIDTENMYWIPLGR